MIPPTTKDLEEIMKTVILTPNSSVKSSTTIESNPPGTRDNFYFPGCRKDANCTCEICIDSINATLDLIPQSSHRSSLTKLSVSRRTLRRSPIPFASPTDALMPKSSNQIRATVLSPPRNPNASLNFWEKEEWKKKESKYEGFFVRLIFVLIVVCGVEYGSSWVVSGVSKNQLRPELVKNMAENSWVHEDLKGRFLFLEKELEGFVGNRVSSCTSADSVWEISQDGLLLNERCVLYESMSEEVSIWGWPLQTAGLLTAEYSSKSLGIISGRVTQWSSANVGYIVRTANSSWVQEKWSASVVQFDPNTWILEYKQSFLVENARPVSATLKFLKFRLMGEFAKMKQDFWQLSSILGQRSDFRGRTTPLPT